MKTPFRVGDRVRVYATTLEHLLVSDCEVTRLYEDGERVRVRPGKYNREFTAHVKQCRRLVKKRRREWWLVFRKDGTSAIYGSQVDVSHGDRVVMVREVKKK